MSSPLYSSVRQQIRDGDLLVFSGRGFYSWLIKRFTYSYASHVGLALWIHGRLCIIEAHESGRVRVFPFSVRLREYTGRIDWYELEDQRYNINRQGVVGYALSHWGDRYSWKAVISNFLLGKEHPGLYCSKLIVDSLRHAGWKGEGIDDKDPNPGEIALLPCYNRLGSLKR